MTFYHLDTKFINAPYKGKTIREIIDIEPEYINWCAINLDDFYTSENIIEQIKTIIPIFEFSTSGLQSLKNKYLKWADEQDFKDLTGPPIPFIEFELDTILSFGIYKGKTLMEALLVEPAYADWCCINNTQFYINDELVKTLQKNPETRISGLGIVNLVYKFNGNINYWHNERERIYDQKNEIENHKYSRYKEPHYRDGIDWSNYNDDLDMDQQSLEFWNQF